MSAFVGNEDFQQLPGELRATIASVQALSARLQAQVDSTGDRLDTLLDDANTTVQLANQELPQLAEQVRVNLAGLQEAILAFESGMRKFEGVVDYDSNTVYQLNSALEELAQAGRALQQLGRALEEHPESLLRGRKED